EELRAKVAPEALRRARRRGRSRSDGLLLHRARAVVEEVAAGLGGAPAGDPRRGTELSARLAVVVRDRSALDRLEELAGIVAVAERHGPRAVAVTADGSAVDVVAAPPGRFGTELVRATGS